MTASVIIGIVVIIAILYLYRSSKKSLVPNQNGQKELRANKLWLYLGLLLIAALGIFWIATFIYNEEGMIYGASILTLFFGLGARYSLNIYNKHQVIFDEKSIFLKSNSSFFELKWKDIANIFPDHRSASICLQHEGGEISFSYLLVGFSEFITEMENQTQWKGSDLDLPIKR